MTEQSKLRRIIWAVDAAHECTEIETHCLEAIQAFTLHGQPEIEPVYVIRPQPIGAPFEVLYPPIWSYSAQWTEALKERFKTVKMPRLSAPKVLDRPVLTTLGAVKELAKYALATQTDLVVVGTHCRKGVSRLFLGSFAESLLLQSRTPLLMVGTHAKPVKKVDSIFFPTDFEKASECVFPRVIELANSLKAHLYIYHFIQKPLILPVDIVPHVDVPALFESIRKDAQEKLEDLLKQAVDSGVQSDIILEMSGAPESEAIVTAAEARSTSLIAMAGQSGAVLSTIVGSTTRQVVRASHCPVWVLHIPGLAQAVPFEVTEEEVISDLTEHGRERKPA